MTRQGSRLIHHLVILILAVSGCASLVGQELAPLYNVWHQGSGSGPRYSLLVRRNANKEKLLSRVLAAEVPPGSFQGFPANFWLILYEWGVH